MMSAIPTHFLLSYMHRDAGNYKTFGETVLANDMQLTLIEADSCLRQNLIDHEYFYPHQWGLPTLEEGESFQDWHEYQGLKLHQDSNEASIPFTSILQKSRMISG